MPEVKVECYCGKCDLEFDGSSGDYVCPKCGRWATYKTRSIVCEDCGKEMVLDDPLTNECECGTLYNGFGQRLAPRAEWDPEDVMDNYRED